MQWKTEKTELKEARVSAFRNSLIALVMISTASGSANAANALAVNAAAAQDGNFGLEISLDGSANAAYVQDDSPSSETTYRASFWIHRNDLVMDNCGGACSTRFVLMVARQDDPALTVFRLIYARLAADGGGEPRYALRFGVRNDNGDFVYVGGVVLTSAVTRKHVTIEWQAGDPATNNGIARIYTSNDGGTPNLQFERTTLLNSTMAVDQVRVGATSGLDDQPSDASTTGSWYFDSFESYRTLLP